MKPIEERRGACPGWILYHGGTSQMSLQPAEVFLDEGWGHACLVKEHTSPDTEGMGRVFFEVVG